MPSHRIHHRHPNPVPFPITAPISTRRQNRSSPSHCSLSFGQHIKGAKEQAKNSHDHGDLLASPAGPTKASEFMPPTTTAQKLDFASLLVVLRLCSLLLPLCYSLVNTVAGCVLKIRFLLLSFLQAKWMLWQS